VRWRGTVERVETFRRDMDFGEGPATKATLALPPVGTVAARAVVRFPEDAQLRVGSKVSFEGRLFRCDGIGRRLLVEDGVLVGHVKGSPR
jgi:hypothetical protein